MQSLGTANANNCRMETGTLDVGGKDVPVDWDFVNRFPPAAAEHDWQWYPVIAITLKEKCRLYQRYKNQRLLLCKRQMEELGGDRSDRKWNLRFFEVWPITFQVQETASEEVEFLKQEATELAKVHQDASRLAEEQAAMATQWDDWATREFNGV